MPRHWPTQVHRATPRRLRIRATSAGARDGDHLRHDRARARSSRSAAWPTCPRRCRRRCARSATPSRSSCRGSPRSSSRGCSSRGASRRCTFTLGERTFEVTVFDGRLASQVDLVVVDAPGLFDRAGVYGERGEDYPDNALRFAVLSRAAAELARQRAATGAPSTSSTATTGRRRSSRPTCKRSPRRRRRSRRRAPCSRIHNVRPPGGLPEGRAALARARLGALPRRRHRVLRRHQPPQAGHRHRRRGHDGEPDVRARDPDRRSTGRGSTACSARAARRSSASSTASTTPCGTRRPTPPSPRATTRRTSRTRRAARARCRRSSGSPLDAAAPLVACVGRLVEQKGTDLVAAAVPQAPPRDRRAGRRRGRRGRRRSSRRSRRVVAKSHGRAAFARAASEALVHRIFAGGRPRPRAEPLRAVRSRADVRAALRRAAGRPRDGRPRRHHRRLRREARDGHGFLFEERDGGRAPRRDRARHRRADAAALAAARAARDAARSRLGAPGAPVRAAVPGLTAR